MMPWREEQRKEHASDSDCEREIRAVLAGCGAQEKKESLWRGVEPRSPA